MYNLVFCGPVVQFWLERRPVTAEVAGSSPVRSAIINIVNFVMLITVLKAKIHRVPVTHTEIDYEGSCAIDLDYLEQTGIRVNEQIHIYNLNNGERLITYAFEAERGSKIISMNGAAALKASIGDLVIIAAYGQIKDEDSDNYQPKVLTI
mgnify:CR=1 FL=1